MGRWGHWFALGVALCGGLAGCDSEQDAAAVVGAEGFRSCTEEQWARLSSADELVDPIACEYTDAAWNGAAARVIRVEHDLQCEPCWYGACENEGPCTSEIATIADGADGLVWVSEVERNEWPELMGSSLSAELGFDPVDVIGLPLEKGAAIDIVEEGDGLCLQISPALPFDGSYTDCGDSMPDIDLDYAEGILPFDEVLGAIGDIEPIEGAWNKNNVSFLLDDEDPSRSRWSLRVHATRFEVDMDGNVYRKD